MSQAGTELVGRRITRIRRMFYVHDGQARVGDGALEVAFADGSIRLYDAAGNGEALRVESQPWVDPFAEPLDDANRDYIRDVGKWTAFDFSDTEPYAQLCGATVIAVEEITIPGPVVIGVVIHAAGARLQAKVNADELWVDIEPDDG